MKQLQLIKENIDFDNVGQIDLDEIDRFFNEGIKPQVKINESINNVSLDDFTIKGCADDLTVYYQDKAIAFYDYTDHQAYPFAIELGKGSYIGKKGWTHNDIYNSLLSLVKRGKIYRKDSKIISGRIWVGAKTNDFNYALIMFWGETFNANVKPYMEEILERCHVNPAKVVIGVNCGEHKFKPIPLSQWNGVIHQITPQENNAKNLHLMNAKEKRDNTGNFREVRNKKIGQKLTNDKGVEMPMAQYHNMIYQEERKRYNIVISEAQRKRIFDILKK